MKWENPYVTVQQRIESVQRWLLVHAIIYYCYNTNTVEDKVWDNNAKQLVGMKNKYPKEFHCSYYYEVYKDFDGNTGFDLDDKMKKHNKKHYDYLNTIAYNVIRSFGSFGKKK